MKNFLNFYKTLFLSLLFKIPFETKFEYGIGKDIINSDFNIISLDNTMYGNPPWFYINFILSKNNIKFNLIIWKLVDIDFTIWRIKLGYDYYFGLFNIDGINIIQLTEHRFRIVFKEKVRFSYSFK